VATHLRRVAGHAEDAHLLELGGISLEQPSAQQLHNSGHTVATVGPLDLVGVRVRGRVSSVRVRVRVGLKVWAGVRLRVRGGVRCRAA
jgi:hypothetical protein